MSRSISRRSLAAQILLGRGYCGVPAQLLGEQALIRHLQAWKLGARFRGTRGVVLQQHSNDCGPAALQMVLQRLGLRLRLVST